MLFVIGGAGGGASFVAVSGPRLVAGAVFVAADSAGGLAGQKS
jgi:hypothetical protein